MLLLLLTTLVTAGDTWTEFRGPRGDGRALDCRPSLRWDAETNVTWSTPVPGKGWSSPVVIDREAWLTTASEDGRILSALALDLDDGRVLWQKDLFTVDQPAEIHAFNSHASPTPAVDERHAYLSWGSAGLVAVDRASREIVWTRTDLKCDHYRGPGSSPVLHDGRLLLHYDGYDLQYVVCLDTETGETLWRRDRPPNFGSDDGDRLKAYATPRVLTPDDGVAETTVVSQTSFGVFGLRLSDGEELWRVRTDRFSPAGRPVFAAVNNEPRLFVTSGFGKGAVVAIDPRGNGDATETHRLWTATRAMPSKPSPVYHAGHLYCVSDNGVLTRLDATTGDVTAQRRLGGNYSASPLLVSGEGGDAVLVVSDEAGETHVVTADEALTVVATSTLPAGMLASPVPDDDGLLLRTRTGVTRIGPAVEG